jgi:pimeloyl-ACP methyl ester carboxylesterase
VGEISSALYRAGSGEPVLLLHGFTGAWHHWRPVLGDLVARYEVIAPTLAGHDGGPPYEAGNPMTFHGAADHLERHLDEIAVDTAHVVGNSLGGALALELAKRGRARSVVALAPAGGWSPGDGETERLARFFARQIRLSRASLRRAELIMRRPSVRKLALRDAMRHGELLSPAEAVALSSSAARCAIADKALAALRADPDLVLGELDRVSCPVLVASPQFDRILPQERHSLRFRREIPGVEWRLLPGCGHVPMWDDTQLVVDAICEFIDRHLPAASGVAPGATAEDLALPAA